MRKHTLTFALEEADVATYEWDGYIVAVGDDLPNGYDVTVAKEAMPPHITQHFETVDQVEEWLNGTLGYEKYSRVWTSEEDEA